jgi:hypothetical protein
MELFLFHRARIAMQKARRRNIYWDLLFSLGGNEFQQLFQHLLVTTVFYFENTFHLEVV